MLTRDQVKQKWIEIIESVHKDKVFSSVEGAWQLAQWVESQHEESDIYLALLGQVHAAISFETEEEAKASRYGLPPDLAQSIYLALTRGVFPSKGKPIIDDGVGELINAVEHLLQSKLELVAYDQRDMLLLHSVQAARAALKKIREGEASNPSDVGN